MALLLLSADPARRPPSAPTRPSAPHPLPDPHLTHPSTSLTPHLPPDLFAGTVLACGTTDQVAQLDDLQRAGKLGCFALTERLAGVHSGLVVNTTATWRNDGSIILNTPNDGAVKNWISQGCTADSAVVRL